MSAWQPIDSAPRDGTWIITYSPAAKKRPVRLNHWDEGAWQLTNATYWPPTHWQPLPEPPA